MAEKTIGFIGQGWIGKNYADDFENRGYRVVRYSLEEPHVQNGDKIQACDIVFIAVPTPSTPQGFDASILKAAVKKVGAGQIAVIKSTLLPGTTEEIQRENPGILIFHSPEFLTEATAARDAANPKRNIIGCAVDSAEYKEKAKLILSVLPKAPYELICRAKEAELIKYGGNNWFYFKVVFVNLLYDLAMKNNCDYEVIRNAMAADPRIGVSHLMPVHKSGTLGSDSYRQKAENDKDGGRGAGGHCFIKDFAAFRELYEKTVGDEKGVALLRATEEKNIELLVNSGKDLDLLKGVYGEEAVKDMGLTFSDIYGRFFGKKFKMEEINFYQRNSAKAHLFFIFKNRGNFDLKKTAPLLTEKIRAICRQKNMQILCGRASSQYVYLQILFASEFSFKEAGDLIKKEAEKYFKENIFLFPELMKGGVLWEDEFLAIPFYQAADLDIKSLADDFIKYLDARAESKGFFRRPVKCLVTGGAGFIGSNLVDALIERGDEVIIIDNLSTGKAENINPKAKFHKTDIRDLAAITPLFKDVDYVFHFAAFPRVQPSIEDPATANDINLNGTLNVLIAARDAKIKKVVYSASSSAYGDQTQMPLREDMPAHPLSPYGLQKYAGELYCRLFSDIYGLPTVCLRYFNVYGKRQALEGAYCLVMGIFVNQRLKGEPMTITNDGEQRRDFTSVVDVVQANILAAESDRAGKGEVINIGRGRNFSVNELAALIGGPTKFIGERIEPKETLADNRLARELLGWEPTVELPEWLEGYKKEMGLAN